MTPADATKIMSDTVYSAIRTVLNPIITTPSQASHSA
jgi:hypothetical protein